MADVASNNSDQFEPKFTELELELPVEGDITIPGAQDDEVELTTLDEPVVDTVMRDCRAVGVKFLHVLYPRQSKTLLKEWDLWGPLILCTLLAILLQSDSGTGNDDMKEFSGFSQVFGLVVFGAVVVALNSKLLGGSLSFFQSICVLGYCVLPLVMSLIVGIILDIFVNTENLNSARNTAIVLFRCILTLAACIWSTLGAFAFLADSQPQHRKALAMYPICLFYFVISWMVLTAD